MEGHHGRGKAICKALLKKGHRVAFTCPSQQDGDVAIKDLKAITSNHKVEYILANKVASIRSVIDLAHVIQQKFLSLDVLIFNNLVELLPAKKQVNEDGLECAFFWKYMIPFVLVEHLGPLLEKNGPDSRIVFIADDKAHLQGHPDILKTPFGKDYHQRSTHSHTESCKVILFRNLSQRFENKVRVMAAVSPKVHPLTDKEISCCTRLMRILPNTLLLNDTNNQMVSSTVWLAESPEAERYHGKYYDGVQPIALRTSVDDLKVLNDWEQWTIDFLSAQR
jgi:NAD(P)-dependent dehydrogenase (short-subunit alcohol dehydrogenase family)